MSPEHLTAVLDHSRQSGSSLAILLVVAAYCDEHGEWTADQLTLQQRARLSRRRVQQILAELIAAEELAVVPGDGRGHRSTYRLLVGPEKAHPSAPNREAPSAFSTPICAAGCALSTQKGAATSTLSVAKGAPGNAFRNPPVPPSPSFPPDPQYSLTPLIPPKN